MVNVTDCVGLHESLNSLSLSLRVYIYLWSTIDCNNIPIVQPHSLKLCTIILYQILYYEAAVIVNFCWLTHFSSILPPILPPLFHPLPLSLKEYIPTSLLDLLNRSELGDEETTAISHQIASAMAYLHSQSILHCDIGARNISSINSFILYLFWHTPL